MFSSLESCKSCSNLSEIFQRMFFDSEIATKFSLGKTKRKHTILCGVALEFKRVLLYDEKFHHFSLFLLKKVWVQIFKYAKWMLLYVFGMIKLVLLKQNILTHNFSEDQLLRIYMIVCTNLWVNLKRTNCCNLPWMTPMLIECLRCLGW